VTEVTEPPRVVGLAGAALMSINSMIGAGIFAVPAVLYAATGNFSPWMFLIFGLFQACTVLVAARLATMFEASGGMQLYVQTAFGPGAGFLTGWLMVLAMAAGRAAVLFVLVSYLAVFFPALEAPQAKQLAVLVLLAGLAALSLTGMRNAIGGLAIGTVLKLAPILVLCVAAFASGGLAVTFVPPDLGKISSVAVMTYFAFNGMVSATTSAGEIKDPRRTLPLAMLLSLAAIILLYMAVQWAYIAAGAPASSGDATPLAAAAGAVLGQAGVVLLTLAAIFSIATNCIAYFIAGPRVVFGMAERGLLPSTLALISPRFLSPDRAILLFSLLVAGISFSGAFVFLASVVSLASQVIVLGMFAAFVRLVRRGHSGDVAGLTPVWAIIVAIGAGFAIYIATQVPADAFILLAGLVLAGSVVSVFARRSKVTTPAPILD
jgi:amino acid transporter